MDELVVVEILVVGGPTMQVPLWLHCLHGSLVSLTSYGISLVDNVWIDTCYPCILKSVGLRVKVRVILWRSNENENAV